MTSTHWGASPTDWAHLADKLGLESDLLPVVADPGATISPDSKMRDLGKTPSRFNKDGHAVGIPKWPLNVTTGRDIARWQADSRLGICVQTRRVKAFDIDIGDPVHAKAVADMLELTLGTLPTRGRNNSGKRLLAFVLPVDFPKRIIRTAHGNIELLSTGQQFIAVSTHPSGARYEWIDSDGVIGLPDALPELTMAEVDVAWQALIDAFALPDGATEARNGLVPTQPRRATDGAADDRVVFLDENGWVLEYERDGRVNIRCPWEGEHTTDSGPSATTYFPAGIGGFAQGHYRCLHAHCAHRNDGDFDNAIGYVADDFDVVTVDSEGAPGTLANAKAWPAFTRARNGQIEATLNNVLQALRRVDICGMHIGFDRFKDKLMHGTASGVWEPFKGNTYTRLRSVLETGAQGFKPIGRELMRDAVHDVAQENAFDSAIQWAESLQWDGVPRVESFWSRYFGVPDTEYSRAVSRYTWSALAGRCLTPGEKCDMVPVLIGLQGVGKTSVIESLSPVPDAFAGINLEKKDEDIARQVRGKLVCELAELRGLASRDAEAIKDWTSRRFEEWVPKYEEFSTRYGRRFLGIGTGNREGFLDDETGERRWLPMVVGIVDHEAVKADRDQLWAEGIARYRANGVEWRDAQQLAQGEHHKFKVGDVWCDVIEAWLQRSDMEGPRDSTRVRMIDVLTSALGLSVQKITRREELRAGKALSLLGFRKGVSLVDGVNAKVWTRHSGPTHAVGKEGLGVDGGHHAQATAGDVRAAPELLDIA